MSKFNDFNHLYKQPKRGKKDDYIKRLKEQIKYLENIVGYAISMIPKEQYPHGVHEGTILPWIKNRVKEEMMIGNCITESEADEKSV